MERLLIITEKPSMGKNFAKALGGASGTFDGDTYVVINLRGHILAHETPEKVAYPNYAATVGKFDKIDELWSYTYFDFDKKVVPANIRDFGNSVIANIRSYLNDGYIPVIAGDIDAMGEGDLLVQEVLTYVGYKGKIYREYHEDETPKSVQKAIRNRKDVTTKNDALTAGTTRMVLDFLTQQLVRVATVTVQDQGYRLPRPVPVGRLQSTMINMVGSQIDALAAYKPSSKWESRYNLDDILILTNPEVEQFKTKEDWHPGNLPAQATVRELKQVPGRTAPPKALSLTGLGKLLAQKGLRVDRTSDLAQAMYDDGVMSYPRTEDKFVTPEQFQEMLPMVDSIISLLGLSPEVFTHRTPRSTHVKTGGSHGALRPGPNMPAKLEDLDIKFGKGASLVYRTVAERFIMMFLEDTEWVRHEYETVDTPIPFKGSLRIITKKGVVDPEEDTKDVATKLPDVNHKANLYAHEVKSIRPQTPTVSWLLGQLEKHNVGTSATQISTIKRLVGPDNNYPLIAGAKVASDPLSLSPIGTVSYKVAKEISLGTPECTRGYEDKVKKVIKGEVTQKQVYESFTEVIRDDIETIKRLKFDLKALGFPAAIKRVDGIWNGVKVSIPESTSKYTFTPEELEQLFAGGSVTFTGRDFNDKPMTTSVKLGYVTHKGKQYVGFHDANYYYGLWKGEEIRFKRSFMGYKFTDDECEILINGGDIQFNATNKDGETVELSGKLERQITESGVKYVGLKPVYPLKEGYVRGEFNSQTVTIKGSFSEHTFTEDELRRLFAGETINIEYKPGKPVSGKLEHQVFEGKRFVGFKPQFPKKKK